MWESLQVVEYFLIHVMNTAPVQVRHEVVSAILNKVNQYTSDPRKYLWLVGLAVTQLYPKWKVVESGILIKPAMGDSSTSVATEIRYARRNIGGKKKVEKRN